MKRGSRKFKKKENKKKIWIAVGIIVLIILIGYLVYYNYKKNILLGPGCSDTDMGQNVNVYGVASDNLGNYIKDSCSGVYVDEAFCSLGVSLMQTPLPCVSGKVCQGGECRDISNLLANPSFENGEKGWDLIFPPNDFGMYAVVDNDAKWLVISGYGFAYQKIRFDGPKLISLSLSMREFVGRGRATIQDALFQGFNLLTLEAGSNQWKDYSGTALLEANKDYYLILVEDNPGEVTGGITYFDNVKLSDVCLQQQDGFVCGSGKTCRTGYCITNCQDDDVANSISVIGTCIDTISNQLVGHPDVCDSVGKLWQANCNSATNLCEATYSLCSSGTTCEGGICKSPSTPVIPPSNGGSGSSGSIKIEITSPANITYSYSSILLDVRDSNNRANYWRYSLNGGAKTNFDATANVNINARVGSNTLEVFASRYSSFSGETSKKVTFSVASSVVNPYCGDGKCSNAESCSSCAIDCNDCPIVNPYCGDGTCDFDESSDNCLKDCPKEKNNFIIYVVVGILVIIFIILVLILVLRYYKKRRDGEIKSIKITPRPFTSS